MKFLLSKNPFLCLVVAMLALSSPGAFANDGANDDLDVTMRMVTDDEALTDSIVREIRLTRPIGLDRNRGQGVDGIDEEAREQGRAFGQEVADRAREAGRLRNEARETRKPDSPGLDAPQPEKPETSKPQLDSAPGRVTP